MSLQWRHARGDAICYESWVTGTSVRHAFQILRHPEPGDDDEKCSCGAAYRDVEHFVLIAPGYRRRYRRFTLTGAQRLAEQLAAGQPE